MGKRHVMLEVGGCSVKGSQFDQERWTKAHYATFSECDSANQALVSEARPLAVHAQDGVLSRQYRSGAHFVPLTLNTCAIV